MKALIYVDILLGLGMVTAGLEVSLHRLTSLSRSFPKALKKVQINFIPFVINSLATMVHSKIEDSETSLHPMKDRTPLQKDCCFYTSRSNWFELGCKDLGTRQEDSSG